MTSTRGAPHSATTKICHTVMMVMISFATKILSETEIAPCYNCRTLGNKAEQISILLTLLNIVEQCGKLFYNVEFC